MRYRRFGRSDLEVSEVGFGTWTLASDWWGSRRRHAGMLHAALDAGINFIDTAPVYGDGGVGESLLADVLTAQRDEIVLTTKCGYDIDGRAQVPRPVGAPARLASPSRSAQQLEASLRRLGTDHIDLYQLHNTRIEPILDDDLWEELERVPAPKARSASSASRSARRSAGSTKGLDALRRPRRSCRCRRCSTCSSRSPVSRSPREPAVADGRRRPHLARAARVRHAVGQDHPRHRVPARATTARTATATTCSTTSRRPRRSRSSGRAPAARSGRPRSPASSPTPRSRPCCPTVRTVDDVREYAAASDLPLTADERDAARRALGATTSTTTTAT